MSGILSCDCFDGKLFKAYRIFGLQFPAKITIFKNIWQSVLTFKFKPLIRVWMHLNKCQKQNSTNRICAHIVFAESRLTDWLRRIKS